MPTTPLVEGSDCVSALKVNNLFKSGSVCFQSNVALVQCALQELPQDSPARQEYNKYIERLQGLKASGKYETMSGGAAPNSRGHEEDVDEGAFGFGELRTDNVDSNMPADGTAN